MMSRKHYKAIAAAMATVVTENGGRVDVETMSAVVEELCRVFKRDNPRFDADRFRFACLPAEVQAKLLEVGS